MLLSSTIALLLAATPLSQLPEDPGPYPAGWQDITFTDANFGQGFVRARIHYPALTSGHNAIADPVSGPFPVVAMMHGWLGAADGLDTLSNHFASHGYLVASIDTHSGWSPDIMDYAWNTRAMLQWAEDESGTPGAWLEGMARGGDWAAIGHSMGGGTISLLIGIEPRVRAIVGMEAADAGAPGPTNMNAFTGAGLWIAGSEDWVVPPATVKLWYQRAILSNRRSFFRVDGMGHLGPSDEPSTSEPMPAAEQTRTHLRLITSFLDAELRANDSAYEYTFSDTFAGAEPWTITQSFARPALWGGASATASSAEFGVQGTAHSNTVFAWSTQLGSTVTPYGTAGIDLTFGGNTAALPLGPDGWARGDFSFLAAWTGTTVYFQAATFASGSGVLTEVLEVSVP